MRPKNPFRHAVKAKRSYPHQVLTVLRFLLIYFVVADKEKNDRTWDAVRNSQWMGASSPSTSSEQSFQSNKRKRINTVDNAESEEPAPVPHSPKPKKAKRQQPRSKPSEPIRSISSASDLKSWAHAGPPPKTNKGPLNFFNTVCNHDLLNQGTDVSAGRMARNLLSRTVKLGRTVR